jgi:aryl-alcohol dehydrogenase
MRCIAAVARAAKAPFVIEPIDVPEPAEDEVLVRIVGVGICATDLASRDGLLGAPFPSVFGHEGAGVVERVGRCITKVKPGDHVVLAPASDGVCEQCQCSAPMYCDRFNELNLQTPPDPRCTAPLANGGHAVLKYFGQSSFAHFALAGERNTVKVPNDVPLKILGPLGCGIQTGAGTVMNGMKPPPGSAIAVLGAGAVGLAAVLGAAVCGCSTIIVVDRVDSRMELARALGATHGINTEREHDLAKAIRAIAPRGANFIVDSAGAPALIEGALGGLAIRGTLRLVAVPPSVDRTLEVPWYSVLNRGQRVEGFVEGNSVPDVFIPQMIDLYTQRLFPFDQLISFYRFEEINKAVADLQHGKTIKAVLVTGSA